MLFPVWCICGNDKGSEFLSDSVKGLAKEGGLTYFRFKGGKFNGILFPMKTFSRYFFLLLMKITNE